MYGMSLSGTAGSAEPTASRFSKNGCRGFPCAQPARVFFLKDDI